MKRRKRRQKLRKYARFVYPRPAKSKILEQCMFCHPMARKRAKPTCLDYLSQITASSRCPPRRSTVKMQKNEKNARYSPAPLLQTHISPSSQPNAAFLTVSASLRPLLDYHREEKRPKLAIFSAKKCYRCGFFRDFLTSPYFKLEERHFS